MRTFWEKNTNLTQKNQFTTNNMNTKSISNTVACNTNATTLRKTNHYGFVLDTKRQVIETVVNIGRVVKG